MGFVGYGHTSNLGSGAVWEFLVILEDGLFSKRKDERAFAFGES